MINSQAARTWSRDLQRRTGPTFGFAIVHRISPTLLAKAVGDDSERTTMKFVQGATTIPLPLTRFPHMKKWLVMDLIPGQMLMECWEQQTPLMRFRIVCTMRRYISQMQKISSDDPGILGKGTVDGPIVDNIARGPFRTAEGFRLWFYKVAFIGWRKIVQYNRSVDKTTPPLPRLATLASWPLVFTHGDLNLGNIILSTDGSLWLIDWGLSGFFPPWWESAGLRCSAKTPISWKRWIPFMTSCKSNLIDRTLWDCFSQGLVHV